MRKTYKYRIYPTVKQQEIFLEWEETCRLMYNELLGQRVNSFALKKYLYFQHNAGTYEELKKSANKKHRKIRELKKQLNWEPYYYVTETKDKYDNIINGINLPLTLLMDELFFIKFNKNIEKNNEEIKKRFSEKYRQKIIDKKASYKIFFNPLNFNDVPIVYIDETEKDNEIIKDKDMFIRVIDMLTNENIKTQRQWYYLKRDKLNNKRLQNIPSALVDTVIRDRVPTSFDNFFSSRAGHPNFKSYGKYGALLFYNNDGYKKIKDNKLYLFSQNARLDRLKKLSPIEIVYHRDLPEGARIKTVEITRVGDRWYACLSLIIPLDIEFLVSDDNDIFIPKGIKLDKSKIVGIDIGMIQLMVLSSLIKYRQENGTIIDTDIIENPRILKQFAKKIAKTHRDLDRKEKKSFKDKDIEQNKNQGKNRFKSLVKLQRAYDDMNNKKQNFLYNVISQIVAQFDYIILEDLDTSNLIKARKKKDGSKHKKGERARKKGFNKSLLDCSFYKIKSIFIEECKKLNKALIFINPAYTTQDCSQCNERVKKSLSTRTHICQNCGLKLDRDKNASLNILTKGLNMINKYL